MKKLFLSTLLCSFALSVSFSQLAEWRGPERSGIYKESGLLKSWPANGPDLVWEVTGMGDGYSSPTVTKDAVYVTGRKDDSDVLFALDKNGKKLWETVYGKAWMSNHTGSRCTPTIYNGNLFLVSGSGDIVCVDTKGKIKWSKNHYSLYDSKPLMFGISESPVVTENMVIVSPGGRKASMVAFNINDGSVIWEAEPLSQEPQYINPKLIEYGGKKILVNVMAKDIVAVNVADGKIMWKFDYAGLNGAGGNARKNHAITPLFKDGNLFIGEGYGWVSVMLKLSGNGTVEKVWENRNFDPQLGGVVMLDNAIYGSNHQSNPAGSWVTVDWTTGKTLWTAKWYSQGTVISADGMLYLFAEKTGHVGLARPDRTKLDIVSEFQVKKGDGPYWAHPVISDGKLYVRHGDYMAVYKIK